MQRRNFLKTASWAALAELAGVSPLRSMAALAQTGGANDYKAIVCLFFRGGNDSNNMIVPLNTPQYGFYSAARGSNGVQRQQLLELPGAGCGLHPAFSNVRQLYGSGQAALIANVGPLVQPTTAAQVRAASAQLPDLLYAHDQQQQIWEAGGYKAGTSSSWSGLTSDLLASNFNTPDLPMVTLLDTAGTFGRGAKGAPFSTGAWAQPASFWCAEGSSCYPRSAAAQQLITMSSDVQLLQADEQVYQDAYKYNGFYNGVLQSAQSFKTAFPAGNSLSGALFTVATMIQLRRQIGARRQIFMIDAGGFDTHANQASVQPQLYAMIDQAVGTFVQVMTEMGVWDQVSLFTASDFSRTLTINSAGGSDHAWGGHHFVLGGALKGGRLVGALPDLNPHGVDDADGQGRFVPGIALSQYLATLAAWFGVPQSELGRIFPGLTNFAAPTLGFI